LAEIADDPTTEWAKSYGYPSDCLFFRRILSGIRTDNRQSQVPYIIVQGAAGKEIYTDCDEAVGEYTVLVTDTLQYPPDFVNALSLRIAWMIAPRLTKGDPFRLQQRTFQLYTQAIAMASGQAFNEEQRDQPPFSEFSRERDGAQIPPGTRQSFLESI
jgi:hypothetical protein